MKPEHLWQRAERYRAIAVQIDDPRACEALLKLADEYEAKADAAERRRQGGREYAADR